MSWKSAIFLSRTSRIIVIALATLLFSWSSPTLFAEETSAKKDEWELQLVPYMWFLSAKGDVTVKGRESDLDLSFNDIWDELNVAGMLAFDARRGRWGFYGDIIAANLGTSTDDGDIEIDPTVKMVWLTAGGYYRIGSWNLSDAAEKKSPTLTLDAFTGLRYTYLDIELELKNAPFNNPSGDQQWMDPLVGSRIIFDLKRGWSLALDGSIGGFGIGSDFAWDAAGLIGYRFGLFGQDDAAVFCGYRARHQDYSDGSGNDKFEWDVTLHGPILGLAIRF